MCRHPQRGATAVEFALVIGMLLAITSTECVDYATYIEVQTAVTTAARDGARTGSRLATPNARTSAEAATREALTSLGISCGTGCSVVASDETVASLAGVRVRATVPFRPLFGLIPAPIVATGTCFMVLEKQP